MIQNSILCDDELRARYRDVFVTPFPVNTPEYWKYYVPSDAVQIMRILDPWDQEKQNLFRSYGFQVAILEGKRVTSGTEIRRDILSGETDWRTRVPLGALEVLEHWLRQESI
jgi:nicotinamide-nucleotide adenylyltransferase